MARELAPTFCGLCGRDALIPWDNGSLACVCCDWVWYPPELRLGRSVRESLPSVPAESLVFVVSVT